MASTGFGGSGARPASGFRRRSPDAKGSSNFSQGAPGFSFSTSARSEGSGPGLFGGPTPQTQAGGGLFGGVAAAPASTQPAILKRQDEAPKYGATTVTMLVGPNEEASFAVHEALARRESDFIETIFRNGWKEREERVIRLPEHHVEHFQVFFNFIYARCIFTTKDDDRESGKVEEDQEWDRLAHCYALAAYLQATDFKDAITDAIIEKVRKCGNSAPQCMHQIIYPNSTVDSGIRRLLVDVAAHRWPTTFLKAQRATPEWSDFFVDLSVALHGCKLGAPVIRPSFETIAINCAYHSHGIESTCYRSKHRYSS